MTHAYSKDSLIEQPAIQPFAEMVWQTVSALEEVFGISGWFDHETKAESGWAKLLTLLYSCPLRLLSGQVKLNLMDAIA